MAPSVPTEPQVPAKQRYQLIRSLPLFSSLTQSEVKELSRLFTETFFKKDEVIVQEGELVDKFFLIVVGTANVTQKTTIGEEQEINFLASLSEGAAIGLSQTGFFSKDSKRTATVTAASDMLVLGVSVNLFVEFLKKNKSFDQDLQNAAYELKNLNFIKQIYPFTHLHLDEIKKIANEVRIINYPANVVIFNKEDAATECFLLQKGSIELFNPQKSENDNVITIIKAPYLIGETALLTRGKRNASAKTLEETELLVLDQVTLFKLIKTSEIFSESLMAFTVFRFRPVRKQNVVVKKRMTKDGHQVLMLYEPESNHHYRLTDEGFFIWEQLDGIQSIRDLSIAFYKKYNAFSPEQISTLLYDLAEQNFISLPAIESVVQEEKEQSKLLKFLDRVRKNIFSKEWIFTQVDPIITNIYNGFIKYFFKLPVLLFFSLWLIAGLFILFNNYETILIKSSQFSLSFWIFLILLFLVIGINVLLHEAGHAFTAKKYGFKVQRIGLAWFGFGLIAFVDTSEVWLAERKQRLAVNAAGIFIDFLLAATSAIFSVLVDSTNLSVLFWLFGLFFCYNALKNLSPISEYDGYLILSDLLDHLKLRKEAIRWLASVFKKEKVSSKQSTIQDEKIYWLCAAIYLLVSAGFLMLLINILFKIFGIVSFLSIPVLYIAIIVPLIILVINLWLISRTISFYIRSS